MDASPELAKKSSELFEAITQCALNRVQLEDVRKDRAATSEAIMDAAQAFRSAEAKMNVALGDLLNLQCDMLRKAG